MSMALATIAGAMYLLTMYLSSAAEARDARRHAGDTRRRSSYPSSIYYLLYYTCLLFIVEI